LTFASLFTLATLVVVASSANAATLLVPLSSTYGAPLTGSITIDDGANPGKLVITAQIDTSRGDVRSILGQIADESLIDGLSVVGGSRRAFRFDANGIGGSGKSRGLGRSGEACPCDFGIRFPSHSGSSVSFTVAHATQNLTVALFYGQDFALNASGILNQVSRESGHGHGSKSYRFALLEGRAPSPIPEPTTAMLMALGLAGLSYAGRPSNR
jgi:hypothetical protein